MNKILIYFLFICTSLSAYAKLIIISDLDDTIRQVNVSEIDEASLSVMGARSKMRSILPFKDLRSIYQDLEKNQDVKFYYLSASYPFIYNAKKWLDINKFPEGAVFQRKYSDEFSSSDFKQRILKEILADQDINESEFIFFGDNGEHDPETYTKAVEAAGIFNQSTIYIRDVVTDATFTMGDSRDLIPGIHYFLVEKVLLTTPIAQILSVETIQGLEQQNENDVPLFIHDNLDERIESNICSQISLRYHFRKRTKCHFTSGSKASSMIKNFFIN